MKLYFDLCCYSRLYDDQGQMKIYLESEAILNIINLAKQNNVYSGEKVQGFHKQLCVSSAVNCA